jgi:hypothetical protein
LKGDTTDLDRWISVSDFTGVITMTDKFNKKSCLFKLGDTTSTLVEPISGKGIVEVGGNDKAIKLNVSTATKPNLPASIGTST